MLVGLQSKELSRRDPSWPRARRGSADGLTWTFAIRHGVTWQDGVPLTASDVAFTYNYIIKNDLFAFTSYTTGIKNVVALSIRTRCQFNLSRPKADMLRSLGCRSCREHISGKISGKVAGQLVHQQAAPS